MGRKQRKQKDKPKETKQERDLRKLKAIEKNRNEEIDQLDEQLRAQALAPQDVKDSRQKQDLAKHAFVLHEQIQCLEMTRRTLNAELEDATDEQMPHLFDQIDDVEAQIASTHEQLVYYAARGDVWNRIFKGDTEVIQRVDVPRFVPRRETAASTTHGGEPGQATGEQSTQKSEATEVQQIPETHDPPPKQGKRKNKKKTKADKKTSKPSEATEVEQIPETHSPPPEQEKGKNKQKTKADTKPSKKLQQTQEKNLEIAEYQRRKAQSVEQEEEERIKQRKETGKQLKADQAKLIKIAQKDYTDLLLSLKPEVEAEKRAKEETKLEIYNHILETYTFRNQELGEWDVEGKQPLFEKLRRIADLYTEFSDYKDRIKTDVENGTLILGDTDDLDRYKLEGDDQEDEEEEVIDTDGDEADDEDDDDDDNTDGRGGGGGGGHGGGGGNGHGGAGQGGAGGDVEGGDREGQSGRPTGDREDTEGQSGYEGGGGIEEVDEEEGPTSKKNEENAGKPEKNLSWWKRLKLKKQQKKDEIRQANQVLANIMALRGLQPVSKNNELPKLKRCLPQKVRRKIIKKLQKQIADVKFERLRIRSCISDYTENPDRVTKLVRQWNNPSPEPHRCSECVHHLENASSKAKSDSGFGMSFILQSVVETAKRCPPQRLYTPSKYHEVAPGYRPSIYGDVHRYQPSGSAFGELTSVIFGSGNTDNEPARESFKKYECDSDNDYEPPRRPPTPPRPRRPPTPPRDIFGGNGRGWDDGPGTSGGFAELQRFFEDKRIMGLPPGSCPCAGENCQNRCH